MTYPTRPTLMDGDLRLRGPLEGDVAARVALGNPPEIIHLFGGDPASVRPIAQKQAAGWVEADGLEPLARVIELSGAMIGGLRLHSVNEHARKASYAIGILDPQRLNKGLETRATWLVLEYAFNTLGLNRLSIRMLAFNKRAIACYRKVGFVVEGCGREAALIGDEWFDEVMMGLLARDWRASA
ncbi:MAG: GNAT family N-acetyltransferase [Sulfitobacter sp.]|nr:GNAT family N-acetyltransferase [Sulfitobacter sp.]